MSQWKTTDKVRLALKLRVGFHLGPRPKKPKKLSDPISQEQNFGPKEFPLRFTSKVWENEMTLMWRHFPIISRWSTLKKIDLILWKLIYKLEYNPQA